MKKQLLIALGGPIGVGKTTWIKKYKNDLIPNYQLESELFDDNDKTISKIIRKSYDKKEYIRPEEQLYLCNYMWKKYEKARKSNKKIVFDRGVLDPYAFGVVYYAYHEDEESFTKLIKDLEKKMKIFDKEHYLYLIFICNLKRNLKQIKKRNRDFEKNNKFIKFLCKKFNQALLMLCKHFEIDYNVINLDGENNGI